MSPSGENTAHVWSNYLKTDPQPGGKALQQVTSILPPTTSYHFAKSYKLKSFCPPPKISAVCDPAQR